MADPHTKAIDSALEMGSQINDLIAELGTAEHPNGAVMSAYRAAARAIEGNVTNPLVLNDALAALRAAIRQVLRDTYSVAASMGMEQAIQQLEALGLPTIGAGAAGTIYTDALEASLAILEAQIAAVKGIGLATGDQALILGDASRAGVLTPGPVVRESSRWTAVSLMNGYSSTIDNALERAGARDEFVRQAIAAIDERTTDCCLRANGQTENEEGLFHLTGTPRFADYMASTPFHWFCRTGIGLIRRRDANDALTRQMRHAGDLELAARAQTGELEEIHPAHARSVRGQGQ